MNVAGCGRIHYRRFLVTSCLSVSKKSFPVRTVTQTASCEVHSLQQDSRTPTQWSGHRSPAELLLDGWCFRSISERKINFLNENSMSLHVFTMQSTETFHMFDVVFLFPLLLFFCTALVANES